MKIVFVDCYFLDSTSTLGFEITLHCPSPVERNMFVCQCLIIVFKLIVLNSILYDFYISDFTSTQLAEFVNSYVHVFFNLILGFSEEPGRGAFLSFSQILLTVYKRRAYLTL